MKALSQTKKKETKEMNGTVKQIAWATDIQAKMIETIVKNIEITKEETLKSSHIVLKEIIENVNQSSLIIDLRNKSLWDIARALSSGIFNNEGNEEKVIELFKSNFSADIQFDFDEILENAGLEY